MLNKNDIWKKIETKNSHLIIQEVSTENTKAVTVLKWPSKMLTHLKKSECDHF